MSRDNAIIRGIKEYGSAHALFLKLKERAGTDGLLAIEWDWYRARQKEWEPEVLAAEAAEASRQLSIRYAHKLSIEDLESVLSEKRGSAECHDLPPFPFTKAGDA